MLDLVSTNRHLLDLVMAVCRKTRVIKLTVLLILIILGLSYLFPDELQNFMSQFAPPPNHEPPHNHAPDPVPDQSAVKESIGSDEVMMPGHVVMVKGEANRRSEHEPYLTPGNPGNFEPLREEEQEGPGENGEPHFTKQSQKREVDESINEYGMNMVASNEISLDRNIPDTRLPECKNWHYPGGLPKASVVIVFHNEGRSTLMRTVHSIINRTPAQFLEEVLLVDDFSDKEDLGIGLDNYIRIFRGQVRLHRNKERQGLIGSRNTGARHAKGVVVVFLDAHCEVNRNWLPPLLAPIYRNYTTMTVPIIDGVDHETFEYRPVYQGEQHFRGIFEWGMLYKESELPESEAKKRKHNSAPYPSPTHAGGLFAINREYFLSLGAYDPGLLVWGAENFELSFKVWQCGGSILWVPCSRVGHVYRGFMPYNFGKLTEGKKGPIITLNYKRVVEVWFDDKYKEYFYTREPSARYLDAGDISEQLAMKKRLQCKSFDWFVTNIAPDLLENYPPLPPNKHVGIVINQGARQCLDTGGKSAPANMEAGPCSGWGQGQVMRMNAEGQLGVGERCVDADMREVRQIFCPMGVVSGPWNYDENSQLLHHRRTKKCLSVGQNSDKLSLGNCDASDNYQKWLFKETKPSWAD